jgi:UDP-N-acetylglucosamine--N-acetylmuramyl-(pentapeptide) pyrophosphoryl-undecaprenol N-acetylglucosamine transferase
MAGGTGGHVMPALAVAAALRDAGWRVVWMGAPGSMESRLVPRHGYDMAWVDFGGVRGKGLVTKLLMPLRLLRALSQAGAVLRRLRPSVVLGMGGYITVPGGLMAALLRRPLVIHEQNSTAGMANRVLARFATRVLTAFPSALPRARQTGNPVRAEIASLQAPAARYGERNGALRLLVVGGSLGAQVLNETIPQALAQLPADARPLVVHQAGDKHLEALRQHYAGAGVAGELIPFIDDMAAAYRDADLVVCRAGATTVAELAAAGVASVLVPYPHAVDDHQTANAKYLADAGAAILVPQRELEPRALADLLRGLTRPRLLEMAARARALARPDATQRVAQACVEAAGLTGAPA